MSLPKKEEKGYLEVGCSEGRLSVAGLKEHVVELEHVFTQHGISCQRGQATADGMETLLFAPEVDAWRVRQVLEQSSPGLLVLRFIGHTGDSG